MHLGSWPEVMRYVNLAMIPKPHGGWRVVGLVPSMYRLWARCYAHVATAWWGNIIADRRFLKFGKGMAAQQAIHDIMLRSEADIQSG